MGGIEGNSQDIDTQGFNPSAEVQIGDVSTSLSIVQGLFKEFAAKSSRYSKLYSDSVIVHIDDITDLHSKILDSFKIFHINVASLYAQIYYSDGTSIRHASVKELTDSACTSSLETESVLLQYNFLMGIPNTQHIQKCEVSIRIISRIILDRKLRNDFGNNTPSFLLLMGGRPIMVEIDYVNILVGTSLSTVIDKWVNGLEKNSTPSLMPLLKHNSHWIPVLLSRISAFVSSIACLYYYKSANDAGNTEMLLAEWITFSFIVVYLSHTLSVIIGRAIEGKIDSWSPLSYICMTKADKKFAKKREKEQRKGAIIGVVSFLASLPSALLMKIVVEIIFRTIK